MRALLCIFTVLFLGAPPVLAQDAQTARRAPDTAPRTPDVIYVPTPPEVVEEMLKLAEVKKGDVLYDLGSGDGRIAVTAAKKYGIRAVGIDIDPERIREAGENAKRAGVAGLVEFRREDLFSADFREATVVTLYLLPELNLRLRPRLLAELKPGTRIVSHQFDMAEWKPEKQMEVNGRTIYFWTIPAKKQ
jgi:ribosomal protein L11 methylase PrmA